MDYTHNLIEKLKVACRGTDVPWEAAIAIAERETKLWDRIDPKSWFYIERLLPAKITGLTIKDIEKMIRPREDLVILWRFEEKNWEWAKSQTAPGLWLSRKFLLCSSFGPFQKSMREYTKHYTKDQWVKMIEEFKDSPSLQISQVVVDLKYCLKQAKGDWELAFSYYNSGKLEKSEYGLDTYNKYLKWSNLII